MKKVKMSLVNLSGEIVNDWTVPYVRRHDALDHALDRAEQEGHAGVLWAVFKNGVTNHIAFDSHDPLAAAAFAGGIRPYMTARGIDVNKLLGQRR